MAATTSTRLEGIDVSHWQGTIDWAKVRAAGKRFAYIKASEHTSFVDDKYQTDRSRAKSAGLKVGAYHFARPNIGTTDAYAEADHFIETADWTTRRAASGARPGGHRRSVVLGAADLGQGVRQPHL